MNKPWFAESRRCNIAGRILFFWFTLAKNATEWTNHGLPKQRDATPPNELIFSVSKINRPIIWVQGRRRPMSRGFFFCYPENQTPYRRTPCVNWKDGLSTGGDSFVFPKVGATRKPASVCPDNGHKRMSQTWFAEGVRCNTAGRRGHTRFQNVEQAMRDTQIQGFR